MTSPSVMPGRPASVSAGTSPGRFAVRWLLAMAVVALLAAMSAAMVTTDVHGLRGFAVDLLPFPRPYRDGMRIQFGFEDTRYGGFLFGRRYTGPLWYYLPTALLLYAAVSSVRTYPYYLPYSNEAFGGPSKTYLRLHDSNVDWGQDLGRLADRLRQRYAGRRIWLVYKGSGLPSYYGIHAPDPRGVPPDDVHGLLVVSDSAIDKADDRPAALIGTSTPIDEVGHSITIFNRR